MLVMQYKTGIIDNGLILRLDPTQESSYPGTGTVLTDISSNSYNGTLVNSPVYDGSRGFSLNGTSQHVLISNNDELGMINAGTVMIWTKRDDWQGDTGALISKTQSSGWSIYFDGNTDGLITWVHIGGAYRNITHPVGTNNSSEWYNIAMTFDGQYLRLYHDAVEVDSYNHGSVSTVSSSPATLTIGGEPDGAGGIENSNYWEGAFGQTLMYSRALSPSEVSHNFDVTKALYDK